MRLALTNAYDFLLPRASHSARKKGAPADECVPARAGGEGREARDVNRAFACLLPETVNGSERASERRAASTRENEVKVILRRVTLHTRSRIAPADSLSIDRFRRKNA